MGLFEDIYALKREQIIWIVRAFYIFAAYTILIVRVIPDLKQRFLDYGARATSPKRQRQTIQGSTLPSWFRVQFDPVLDWLADITVPHSWFTHFYICSTLCSTFWLYRHHAAGLLFRRSFLNSLLSCEGRTILCTILLQVQGLRRLYECLIISKTSSSRMWMGHYWIGIAFYVFTNIAVWVESGESRSDLHRDSATWRPTISNPLDAVNIFRVVGCTMIFLWSSSQQFRVHQYLASLKQYRVPDHPIFTKTNVVCPHYGFEVYIYLAFTILTAQDTRILNITMLCATSFVAINLGITADLTKKWQMNQFPKQRPEIVARKCMLDSLW